jgi:hypothetical protein
VALGGIGVDADAAAGGRVEVGKRTGVLVGDSPVASVQEVNRKRTNRTSVIFLII